MANSSMDVDRLKSRLKSYLDANTPDKDTEKPIDVVQVAETARANATKILLLVYASAIAVCALLVILHGFQKQDFKGAVDIFLEIMKISVVPIITLVLGHYYGASGR